ncbi:MAG: BlaI/MecI/CopY family transcriptional regulator [Saprospiraceae bacterium]|nr:BlaI/MecI/CopY family transcriptional regulator [Saprospiraceae bacterium]MBK8450465.1 BlaI/MecI/CopY family transcriptional regulator [Saprospiraceae bacterium]MBK8485452.1 BlaI/MecI/CopY family transcriptional regulator [Saprospiraceae bacterium]MBK9222680.1 BlaI/MecI/CopY family transcriptional regulator [Saprospiraceae bacterium]MBK9720275.1 BlaI/MecI/CopY family transcriptional regulator [Saprospiraceae bacterium]
MTKIINKPTDGELEILQILWKYGPCTVKKVNGLMNEKKEVGYTTSLKMLQIMMDKGLCVREAEGKLHIYKAAIKELMVKKNFLKDMIDQVFEGSPMEMVMQTLGNYKASTEEISDLKKLLKDLENKQSA